MPRAWAQSDLEVIPSIYEQILKNNAPSSAARTEDVRGAVKKLAGFDPGPIDEAIARKAT